MNPSDPANQAPAFDIDNLIQRLAADPALHDEVRQHPQQAIEKIMNLAPGTLDGCDIQIVETKPNSLVIPVQIPEDDNDNQGIADAELQGISGGASNSCRQNNTESDMFGPIA